MASVQLIRGRVLRGCVVAAVVVWGVAASSAARADDASATFVAHYAPNVPLAVRGAVEAAMSIYAQRLVARVPIEVDVEWGGGLPRNVASMTEPTAYERVADGSMQPVALANALAGRDLDPAVSDMRLTLGAGIRWYTGVDGGGPSNATDMVTMVLHELTHGLGFADSFHPAGGGLAWGHDGVPVGLDAHLVDASTGDLVHAPSASELLAAATSRRIVWRGAARDSHGRAPIMYAPAQFEPGSSLCHFDDNAYPQGDPDALMTSLVRRGEVIHRIGPAALGVLHDLGWTVRAEPAPAPTVAPSPPPAPTSTTAAPVAYPRPRATGGPRRAGALAPRAGLHGPQLPRTAGRAGDGARSFDVAVALFATLPGGIRRDALRLSHDAAH
jgi:hypothetical protein